MSPEIIVPFAGWGVITLSISILTSAVQRMTAAMMLFLSPTLFNVLLFMYYYV